MVSQDIAATTASLIGIALSTALFAGVYGAVHDQVSFTISPEYFTKMKFHQFAYANFGWPPRVLAAEVGFLASWWVGLIGGWILARRGLAELVAKQWMYLPKALVVAGATAAACGTVGATLGMVASRGDVSDWNEYQRFLDLQDLRGFIVVAYLHWASYLGGVAGIIVSARYVKAASKRSNVEAS